MFEAWLCQSIASTLRIIGVSFKLLVLVSKEGGLNAARILTVPVLHRAGTQRRQRQTLIDANSPSHFRWWMLTEENLILFSVLLTFFKHMGRQRRRYATLQNRTSQPAQKTIMLFMFTFRVVGFSDVERCHSREKCRGIVWRLLRDCPEQPVPATYHWGKKQVHPRE